MWGLSPETKSKLVTLPFCQVRSDVIHSCLIFNMFNLSALTQFSDFQSSPLQMLLSPVVRLSEFYLTRAHTLKHTFFEDTVSWHTLFERNAKKKIHFLIVFALFIYLFQARRRLLYVMYISFRITIYMHFVSFFFCFLCNIIHRLV